MTGFIRGLFSRNNNQAAAPQPRQTGAYFLSDDDAKSFGDIDYMRSSKVVRRTFARKKGVTEELESVRQISAMDAQRMNERGTSTFGSNGNSTTSSFQPSTPPASTGQSSFQRRTSKTDTSMDMFRNMAKDMKKR